VQPAVRQTHCEWRYFHLNTNHYQALKQKEISMMIIAETSGLSIEEIKKLGNG